MIKHDVEQGTPEWLSVRLGIPTASGFDSIITPLGAASKSADGYADELLAELIAGEPLESWGGNQWTDRGKKLEQDAADFYETLIDEPVEKVGFVTDDSRTMGCSPDRLVGTDGLLEIKIPAPKTHVGYMLTGKLDQKYYPQTQGQMIVTGRKWCDIMSYHPLMPQVIIRIERNEKYLFEMSRLLGLFNMTLKEKKQILISKGFLQE